jgi:hypothetical protein
MALSAPLLGRTNKSLVSIDLTQLETVCLYNIVNSA